MAGTTSVRLLLVVADHDPHRDGAGVRHPRLVLELDGCCRGSDGVAVAGGQLAGVDGGELGVDRRAVGQRHGDRSADGHVRAWAAGLGGGPQRRRGVGRRAGVDLAQPRAVVRSMRMPGASATTTDDGENTSVRGTPIDFAGRTARLVSGPSTCRWA